MTHMRAGLAALLASTALTHVAMAQTLPTGGVVVDGSADIGSVTAGGMDIVQNSDRVVIDWQSFSLGNGTTLQFFQPGPGSAALNRVTGDIPTVIDGTLTANGQVFIANESGVIVGESGRIKAGGFVATTLGISNDDFMSGRLRFSGDGSSAGVSNAGTIEVMTGGYAALLGGRVTNTGTVLVPFGKIGFGAGERVTLDLSGDNFLQVTIPSDDDGELTALINNSGLVSADGGVIEMEAAVARYAARHAVNMSGVVEAKTVGGTHGAIILGGGGGSVRVSGRVAVHAPETSLVPGVRPGTGGRIEITGADIALEGATLDASGPDGGGTILVGGDVSGGGTLPVAEVTTMDGDTTIAANATVDGDGGTVVLFADGFTGFDGAISAVGAGDGAGGFIEISGRQALSYAGTIDLSAASGNFGTLLIDPYDVTISTDATTTGGPGFVDQGGGVRSFDAPETPSPFNINVTELITQLGQNNVVISAIDPDDTATGSIEVNAPITWQTAFFLELVTDGNIALNQAIRAPSGELALEADGIITSTAAVDVGTFTLFGGTWEQNGAALPAFAAQDFDIGGGQFIRAVGGDGAGAPYQITDIYGLQGMGSGGQVSFNFDIINDIDASVTSGWTGGFTPLGSVAAYNGTANGNGHTIRGLSVETDGDAGLFATVGTDGAVTGIRLSGASVTGADNVGGIAGNNNGFISLVEVTNSLIQSTIGVNDGTNIGGLIGNNDGVLALSAAGENTQVTVLPGPGSTFVATNAGGAVGSNDGLITSTYSFANVLVETLADGADVGGFVGHNVEGTINQAFSTGTVNAVSTTANVGGFAGNNTDTVTLAFWDTDTSGIADPGASIGEGRSTAQFQDVEAFFDGTFGFDIGVWAPGDTGFYPELYALNPVVFVDLEDETIVYGDVPLLPIDENETRGGPGTFSFEPDTESLPDEADFPRDTSGFDGDVGTFQSSIVGAVTSTGGLEYRIVSREGTVTVDPRVVDVALGDVSAVKLFGAEIDSFNFPITDGLVDGDSATGIATSPGGLADAPLGPYEILYLGAVATDENGRDITGNYIFNPIAAPPFDPDAPPGTPGTVTVVPSVSNFPQTNGPGNTGTDTTGNELPDPPVGGNRDDGLPNGVTPPPGVTPPLITTPGFAAPAGAGPTPAQTLERSLQIARTTQAAVGTIAEQLELALEACRSESEVPNYLSCVASALEDFGTQLEALGENLPPELEAVGEVVLELRDEIETVRETTETRLAQATTDEEREEIEAEALDEAQALVQAAIEEIRAATTLIRADDEELQTVRFETGERIVEALENVETGFARTSEL